MSLKSAICGTKPTSYWPLDDPAGSDSLHDECGLHDGIPCGVSLAEVPFGTSLMPHFDGQHGSKIFIPNDKRYSHDCAKALTVACWVSPSALNFYHTDGSKDQYVHIIEKAHDYSTDVEWAFRLYNATNRERHSRLSFYLFNLGHPAGKGAGAYMEHGEGKSENDEVPVEARRWLFLVGQGEEWVSNDDKSTGAIFYKQGVMAERTSGDKYNNPKEWNVHPQHGPGVITLGGSINKTAFCGGIAHVALWNRLLEKADIEAIFRAGQDEIAGDT